MSDAFPKLTKACQLLGHDAICPEALQKLGQNEDLFSRTVRREFRDFMKRIRHTLFEDGSDELR